MNKHDIRYYSFTFLNSFLNNSTRASQMTSQLSTIRSPPHLPFDVLTSIAQHQNKANYLKVYHALLSLPRFARKTLGDIAQTRWKSQFTIRTIDASTGAEQWTLNGRLHSPILADGTVGPALTIPERVKYWCQHGSFHRVDQPAILRNDGTYEYWYNGLRHREISPDGNTGPALSESDGTQEWYLNGCLHRIGGPARITPQPMSGCSWYIHGQRHREDGPAQYNSLGFQLWYYRNMRHRNDGPAMITAGGALEWYYYDQHVTREVYALLSGINN
jgi:hypothetical protein